MSSVSYINKGLTVKGKMIQKHTHTHTSPECLKAVVMITQCEKLMSAWTLVPQPGCAI